MFDTRLFTPAFYQRPPDPLWDHTGNTGASPQKDCNPPPKFASYSPIFFHFDSPKQGEGMAEARDTDRHNRVLFWGCFVALVTTSFGFITRMFLINTWAAEFHLDPAQAGRLA